MLTTIPSSPLLATASAPGAIPHWPLLPADMPATYQSATVVKYDAAFSAATVVINGLSSAKRYRFVAVLDDNGVSEVTKVQPNGSDANCGCTWSTFNGSSGNSAWLYIGDMGAGGNTRRVDGVLWERKLGLSGYEVKGRSVAGDGAGNVRQANGVTSTDFTSLTFYFSATARTGWLTLIEETP